MQPAPIPRFASLLTATLAATALLAPTPTAQTATLLAETGVVANSSRPAEFVAFGPFSYFAARGEGIGRELFRTGGTAASTSLVADITPGPLGSNPTDFAVSGNMLYFVADGSSDGRSLWRTDGTTAGTIELITDLPFSALGTSVVPVPPNRCVVAARFPVVQAVYVSDGTIAGSAAVPVPAPTFTTTIGPERIFPGISPTGTRVAYGTLSRLPGTFDILVSDGTVAGTSLTSSTVIQPPPPQLEAGYVGFAPGLIARGSIVAGANRVEVIDAVTGTLTASGTGTFGFGVFQPTETAVFDGRSLSVGGQAALAIAAADASSVVSIPFPGALGGRPKFLGESGGSLWIAAPITTGTRLLRLDAGSNVLVDVAALPGAPVGEPTQVGSTFYAHLAAPGPQTSFVRIDTPSGTVTVLASIDDDQASTDSAAVPGRVVFTANSGSETEPWVTNGTPAGTTQLADLLLADVAVGGDPAQYRPFGDGVAFIGGIDSSGAAWTSDGTSVNTTPAGTPTGQTTRLFTAGPRLWIEQQDNVSLVDPSTGTLTAVTSGEILQSFGDSVIVGGQNAEFRLVRPDGTETLIDGLNSAAWPGVDFGEHSLVYAVNEYLLTDGTPAGTLSIPGYSSRYSGTVAFDGSAWSTFTLPVVDPLVRIDATGNTPQMLPPNDLRQAIVVDDELYLRSFDGDILIHDGVTFQGVPTNDARFLEQLGDRVLVVTTLGTLVVTDGVTFTTLANGPVPSPLETAGAFGFDLLEEPRPRFVAAVSRELAYFRVDGLNGGELWRTDGTVAGTTFVQDLEILDMAAINGELYLTVDDPATGPEPYVLVPEVFNQPVGKSCSGRTTGTHFLRTDVDPRINRTVQVIGRSRLEGAGAGTVAGIFLGSTAPTTSLLPQSNCAFHLDLTRPIGALTVAVDVDGNFSTPIAIPDLPVLIGFEITLQAAIAPSPGPIGFDLTNGLHWRIGG